MDKKLQRIGFALKNHGLSFVLHLFPIVSKKVVGCSFNGVSFGGNPKYVLQKIDELGLNYKIYWIIKDKKELNGLPEYITPIDLYSLRYYWHMATAQFWIFDSRNPFPYKNKKTHYIQTWHGSIGLKKIEKDAEKSLPASYIKLAKHDSNMADLFLSNCRTLTTLYHNAFWYDGEVLECGLPRNDELFVVNNEKNAEVRRTLNIPNNATVVLYAPTFRVSKDLNAYNIDFERLSRALEDKYNVPCIVLVRLHPALHDVAETAFEWNEHLRNMTAYPDVQELYGITNIALTDFSSVMFDFMYTGKPCLLYATDIDDYKKDRDFFIPIESLPFPLTKSNDELIQYIDSFAMEQYQDKVDQFILKHGFVDKGTASEQVVQWMEQQI